jgi:hypothetical protein
MSRAASRGKSILGESRSTFGMNRLFVPPPHHLAGGATPRNRALRRAGMPSARKPLPRGGRMGPSGLGQSPPRGAWMAMPTSSMTRTRHWRSALLFSSLDNFNGLAEQVFGPKEDDCFGPFSAGSRRTIMSGQSVTLPLLDSYLAAPHEHMTFPPAIEAVYDKQMSPYRLQVMERAFCVRSSSTMPFCLSSSCYCRAPRRSRWPCISV